jgi:hypothetical protein
MESTHKLDDWVHFCTKRQLDNKNYRIRNFGRDFDVIINEEHRKKYGKHYLGTGLSVVFIKLPPLKWGLN